jgi:uncharacterized SAM-binding protein YcdF (DUF218 family)
MIGRQRRRARVYRRLRGVLSALVVGGALWTGGLVWFVGQVPRALPAIETPFEAIVVLTGGVGRLEEGLALLRANPGAKLFVSGVYRGLDVAEILRMDREAPEALACCVELGHDAIDTRGNARETALWVRRHGFTSLLLVTANYHMPRSQLEFRTVLPDVVIRPHPVIAGRVRLDGWWYRPGTAALRASEYTKYLAALAIGTLR